MAFEEITLSGSADGVAVVEVIGDGGRTHLFQYRDRGVVLAEATTLRALAHQLTPLRAPAPA